MASRDPMCGQGFLCSQLALVHISTALVIYMYAFLSCADPEDDWTGSGPYRLIF